MKRDVEFGDCLRMLLSALDLSSSRLARSINLDPSVVSRWINGKRIPAFGTIYITSIANCLVQNIQNSFQRKRLEEVLEMLCVKGELKGSLEEQIKFVLSEAQGYSLERQKNSKKKGHPAPVSNELRIINGYDNIYQVCLSMLDAAAKHEPPKDEAICLFLDTNNDSLSLNNKLAVLADSLYKVINKGWKINFLFRLHEDLEQIADLIKIIDPLIATGQFMPYFFKKYDVFTIGREILVVPNIGALSCFPTNANFVVDSGYYLTAPGKIELLQNYFNSLITNLAKPLAKYFPVTKPFEFASYLSDSEALFGTRIIYKYNFSMLLFPENLYRKLLNRTSLTPVEKQKTWELYEKNLDSFLTNLKRFEHKDIFTLDSCLNLFNQKKFYFCSPVGIEIIQLKNEEIIELLQNIIQLLTKYDNYYLGICHQNNPSNGYDYFCYKVKENQIIIMETYKREQGRAGFKLAIEEPLIVKAWSKYLEELWRQISPVYRTKSEVIKWLEDVISHLSE